MRWGGGGGGRGWGTRRSVKQEKREKIHSTRTRRTGHHAIRKILEAQDRNGGLGAMLKTILEAAAVLHLFCIFFF